MIRFPRWSCKNRGWLAPWVWLSQVISPDQKRISRAIHRREVDRASRKNRGWLARWAWLIEGLTPDQKRISRATQGLTFRR